MASLDITIDGNPVEKRKLEEDLILIGRRFPANIILARPIVSSKHAQIRKIDKQYQLEDLDSSNGTYVNGEKIKERLLKDQDVIQIGDFNLIFHENGEGKPKGATAQKPAAKGKEGPVDEDQHFKLKRRVHDLLLEKMNLKKLTMQDMDDQGLRNKTSNYLDDIFKELAGEFPAGLDMDRFKKEIIDDALGLGPLEDLLEDETITEIMVNKCNQIYIEQAGKLHVSKVRFLDNIQVMTVIQRIVAPLGRAINESTPLVDARLSDGSRVNAIIPPLALQGPTLTIRKFSKRRLTTEDLIKFGSINEQMVNFLQLAVLQRRNIVISGGTGSGKTTLLNIISAFIPSDERIVTVEDSAELNLPQDHVVSLETRPPNIEGKGAITIRELVKNCLRMRPDRIVVGECRGGEALDMLQAMNTGHDGSITTAHANSPRDAISRLETMVLMAGMELPVKAIRQQISSAVNIIVQQARMVDGTRKITHITEVTGMEGEIITLQDIFLFQQKGFDDKGKVLGDYQATGVIPSFVHDLKRRGIKTDLTMFESEKGGD